MGNKQSESFMLDDIKVEGVTLHAYKIRDDDGAVHFIPKSQTHGEPQIGDTCMWVTPYIARAEGFY